MKKTKKIFMAILFAIAIVFMSRGVGENSVQAATGVTYEKIDHSKTFTGDGCTIRVENYYKYAQLKGNTKAIKSINKKLKKMAKDAMEKESGAVEYAVEDCNYRTVDESYSDHFVQKVTYLTKNTVSIQTMWLWYAGGVSNSSVYGSTYNLKTGKQIKNITEFTKESSISKIRKTIVKKALKSDSLLQKEAVENIVNKKKATEFEFYINKNGNVVVCFGAYELGYGGWYRAFTLAGK